MCIQGTGPLSVFSQSSNNMPSFYIFSVVTETLTQVAGLLYPSTRRYADQLLPSRTAPSQPCLYLHFFWKEECKKEQMNS